MRHDYRNLSLISALIVTALTLNFVNSPRAEAETKAQPVVSKVEGPYLYEKHVVADYTMQRFYDQETGVACYQWRTDPLVCVPLKYPKVLEDRYNGKDAK